MTMPSPRDARKLADKILSVFDKTDKASMRAWQFLTRDELRRMMVTTVDDVKKQRKSREKAEHERERRRGHQPVTIDENTPISAPTPPTDFQKQRSALVDALLFGGKAGDLNRIFDALDQALQQLQGLDGYDWYKITTSGKRIQIARERLIELDKEWKSQIFKEFGSLSSRANTAPDEATLNQYWNEFHRIEQFFGECNAAVNQCAAVIQAEELWEAKKAAIFASTHGKAEMAIKGVGTVLRLALNALTLAAFTGFGAAAAPAAAAVQFGAGEVEGAALRKVRDKKIDDKDDVDPDWWYTALNNDPTSVARQVCDTQKKKIKRVLNAATIGLSGFPAWAVVRTVALEPLLLGFFDGQVVALENVLDPARQGQATGEQVKEEAKEVFEEVPEIVREHLEHAAREQEAEANAELAREWAEATAAGPEAQAGYIERVEHIFASLGENAPEVAKHFAEGALRGLAGLLLQRSVARVLGEFTGFAAQAVTGDDFRNLMAACDRIHDKVNTARTGQGYLADHGGV